MSPAPIEPLRTHVAHAEWGVNRCFGHAVPDLLAGGETLGGLLALSVTGRRLTAEERPVIDDIAVAMTLADPRVWPLKMARIASSYGTRLPALACGFLCLEDAYIGPWTFGAAADLLLALRSEVAEPTADALTAPLGRRLSAGERLPGFLVPFRPRCERLPLVQRSIAARRRDDLPHWRTMEAAIAAVRQLNGPEANVGVGVAAACLDLGFTPREIATLSSALALTEFLSNAVEGAEQAAPVLRRLPDDRVRYAGRAPRQSPRARAGQVVGGEGP